MSAGDFVPFKQPEESDEQYRHRLEEYILSEDWSLRFSAHGTEFRVLGDALEEEEDPSRIVELTEQRQDSLVRSLGAGAICLWKQVVELERQQFEADFGFQD